jgi:hypothetical protein
MKLPFRPSFFLLLTLVGAPAAALAAAAPQSAAASSTSGDVPAILSVKPEKGFYERHLESCQKALSPDAMALARQYARKGVLSLSTAQSSACGTEYRALSALSRNRAFRYEVYADLPGLNASQSLWVSELGGWFDQMTFDASSAFACDQVKPVYISLLQQLDTPLAIASLATKGVSTANSQALARVLLDRVGSMLRTVPPGSCKSDYRKDVQSYGQEMQLFTQGKSHWAYGCSASFAYGQTTLRCPPESLPHPHAAR